LPYDHIEERDVMWEKRIWREVDVKELRNHHFANEKRQLIKILLEAAQNGEVAAYGTLNDEFTNELSQDRIKEMLYSVDTVQVYNMDTEQFDEVVVFNEFNPQDVVRYRIKEVWYYDSRLSRMNVRILGIAPIINKTDNDGNFIATMPLCWFHFDDLRPVLAKEPVFNPHNDHGQMSWDDVFLSRDFASYITKESNNRDVRLQDVYSGVDILLESDKIHAGIFNFEPDLYSK
jgi:gliding motility associated protien GldN